MKILDLNSDDPYFEGTLELSGSLFSLGLSRDLRGDRWYLTIRDSNDDTIFAGRRLVIGYNVFEGASDPRLPPGELVPFTARTDRAPIAGAELGTIGKLVYLEPEDVSVFASFLSGSRPIPLDLVIT